jgi:hypothetical protein
MRRDHGRTHELLTIPRVLWPSLGRPVFIDAGSPSFTAVVAAPAGSLGPEVLRAGFHLTPVPDSGQAIALRTAAVADRAALPDSTPLKRVLAPEGLYDFYEVRLDVPAADIDLAVGDRRGGLFTLAHSAIAPSPHSVAWLRHRWERFTFAFVTDIHLARAWSRIEADALALDSGEPHAGEAPADRLRRFFSREAFAANFVNPNRTWRDFIGEANARSRRGDLDLVVVGGDLVDYQEPGNVEHFVDSTTGRAPGSLALEVPLVAVPGNHDYRRLGYRPEIYPLDHWGLHDFVRDHFFSETRGDRRPRLSLGDLKAVFSRDAAGHPLADYLLRVSAAPDGVLRMGRSAFVLLDTGRDVFRSLAGVSPRRWGNYLRTLAYAWLHPASAGLTDEQAALLLRESSAGGDRSVFVIFHAGLVGARIESCRRKGRDGPVVHSPRREDGDHTLRGRVELERAFLRSGLGPGGIFQNHSSLVRVAAMTDRDVLGLSGHMHRPVILRLDKESGDLFLERDGFEALTPDSFDRASYFVNGPALGHVGPRADPPGRPGFIRVEVADGHIVAVRSETLAGARREPFHVRVDHEGADSTRRTITVDLADNGGEARPAVVTFIVFSRPRRRAPGHFPYAIEPDTPESVRSSPPAWIDPQDRTAFFGTPQPAYLQPFRCETGAERVFRVLPAVRPGSRATAAVVVEVLAPRAGGWVPASTWWHPLSIDL